MMLRLPRLFLILFALIFSVPAFAHTKSETQSVWRVVGNVVHVAFTIPDIEIPRLAHPDGRPLSDAELAD